jgi:hypothetical protein
MTQDNSEQSVEPCEPGEKKTIDNLTAHKERMSAEAIKLSRKEMEIGRLKARIKVKEGIEKDFVKVLRMGYKVVADRVHELVKQTGEARIETRAWERKDASNRAKGNERTSPPAVRAASLRATIICAVLAHSRGKLHFCRVGHWWSPNYEAIRRGENVYDVPQSEKGFVWQRQTLLEELDHQRWTTGSPALFKFSIFSSEELAMLEFLMAVAKPYKSNSVALEA